MIDKDRTLTFLNPEQVKESFTVELGKYILMKPNEFLTSILDEDKNELIQEMVREAERHRLKVLRDAELRKQEELLAKKDSKLFTRLKNTIIKNYK